MIKEKIDGCLKKVIGLPSFAPEIFIPENEQFGHYSTNAALKLAKIRGENPIEIAKNLKSQISNLKSDLFAKIEVAPPGFINFWLLPEVLRNELKEILKKKEKYGRSGVKGRMLKVDIEFISANPTGVLTIGNGRGGFFGDVLANILEFAGHKVAREYYVNDAKVSAQIKELGKTALGEGTTYLTENLKFQILDIKSKLKNIKTKKLKNNLYGEAGHLLAQKVQKNNKKFVGKDLKIRFDKWFSEESLYKSGAVEKLLKELKDKNLTYEKDGALWLKTSEFGDNEDRVLVRQSREAGQAGHAYRQAGEPTYFLPDLAYHLDKFKTRKFDKVIDIWGADHHGYEPRLRAGLKAMGIFKDGDEKFQVIITQLARLIKGGKEVKMSKRKGEYVSLEDLIREIGLDAARFFFLMSSPDTHMNFDLDLAKKRSMKNPVYYAQYASVRIQGILTKIKNKKSHAYRQAGKIKITNQKSKINFNLLNTSEDLNLIRMLIRFPEIIEEAAGKYNPQILARYSLDLAKTFHNFYEKERIIPARRSLGESGGEENNLMSARLVLVFAALTVFKNTFSLLGISLPKKM